MSFEGGNRVASLAWSNDQRVRAGRPPFAKVIETRHIDTTRHLMAGQFREEGRFREVWNLVLCPYCDNVHAHAGKKSGMRVNAPCDDDMDYIVSA